MNFQILGNDKAPTLLLIPGLGEVEHLIRLCPSAHVEVFNGMNHGQLLIDHPEEVTKRIIQIIITSNIIYYGSRL